MKSKVKMVRALIFGLVATLVYVTLSWRHQPSLLSRDAPRPLQVSAVMLAILAVASFLSFACLWYLIGARSVRRPITAAIIASGLGAAITPILQLWFWYADAAVEQALWPTSTEEVPTLVAVLVGLGLLGLTWWWWVISLFEIGWITISVSIVVGIGYVFVQRWFDGPVHRERPASHLAG